MGRGTGGHFPRMQGFQGVGRVAASDGPTISDPTNYLRPDIKRGRFTFEEEETIIQLHSILGNKWSAIAARLPGRTDNEIKNYWNTHIRKRLLRMGIDPVAHTPSLDLLDLSSLLYNPNQLNISNLLRMEPLVSSELLRLATTLFSPPQGLQGQSFPINTQTVTMPSLQAIQIVNPIQENPSNCKTLYGQQMNDSQMMQLHPDSGNFLNPADVCYQNLNHGFTENPDNLVDPSCNPSYNGMSSIVSTPASSIVSHLNSSSFSREDDKESFCSDPFQFHISDLLDINDFL